MSDYIKQKKEIVDKFTKLMANCGPNVKTARFNADRDSIKGKIKAVNFHYDDDIKLIRVGTIGRKYKLAGCE